MILTTDQELVKECILDIVKAFIHNTKLNHTFFEKLDSANAGELFRYANVNKIVPVCSAILSSYKTSIPDKIYNQFAQHTRRIALHNMTMFNESKKIAGAFRDNRIVLVPYKGVHFAQLFYRSLSLRQSADVDFAMSLNDLGKVADVMNPLGYREVKGTVREGKVKTSRAYYLDYPWEKAGHGGPGLFIEFHLSPAHKALYVPCDFSDYLADNNADANISPADFSLCEHALFILIHHGAVDLWGQLMHLVDINQILSELDESQIKEFLAMCEEARVRKFLDLGLGLLEEIFDKSHPIKERYEMSNSTIAELKNDCLNKKLIGNWSRNRIKLKYHLQFRDNVADQIRTLWSLGRYGIYKVTGL